MMDAWEHEFLYNLDEDEMSTIDAGIHRFALPPSSQPIENIHLRDYLFIIQPLGIKGIDNVTFGNSFRCQIDFLNQKNIIKFPFRYNNHMYLCNPPSNHSNHHINKNFCYEIYEYYGLSEIKFQIFQKSLFSQYEMSHQKLLTIDNFYSIQEKEEKINIMNSKVIKSWGHMVHICIPKLYHHHHTNSSLFSSSYITSLTKNSYENQSLKNPSTVSSSNDLIDENFIVTIKFKIISLQNCYQLSYTNLYLHSSHIQNDSNGYRQSEFHYEIAYGSADNLIAIMTILTRNQFLRRTLALRDSNDMNPLDVALFHSNYQNVKTLLTYAGHLCFQHTLLNRNCAIHNAIIGGSYECLEILLKFLHKYVNQIQSGSTWGSGSFLSMLEWKDALGNTPLALACSLPNRLKMIRLLISYKAELTFVNITTRKTLLMLAAQVGDNDVIQLLLSFKKSYNELITEESYLRNHLSLARRFRHGVTITHGVNDEVYENDFHGNNFYNPLRLYKCRPGDVDECGRSALMYAAKNGNVDVVKSLLQIGLTIADQCRHGNTIFHYAAEHNHLDLMKFLIVYEMKEYRSYYSLDKKLLPQKKMYTRSEQQMSSLQTMISRKKHLLTCNFRGKSPYDIARDLNHINMLKFIEQGVNDIYGIRIDNIDDLIRKERLKEYGIESYPLSDEIMDQNDHEFSYRKIHTYLIGNDTDYTIEKEADDLDYNFALLSKSNPGDLDGTSVVSPSSNDHFINEHSFGKIFEASKRAALEDQRKDTPIQSSSNLESLREVLRAFTVTPNDTQHGNDRNHVKERVTAPLDLDDTSNAFEQTNLSSDSKTADNHRMADVVKEDGDEFSARFHGDDTVQLEMTDETDSLELDNDTTAAPRCVKDVNSDAEEGAEDVNSDAEEGKVIGEESSLTVQASPAHDSDINQEDIDVHLSSNDSNSGAHQRDDINYVDKVEDNTTSYAQPQSGFGILKKVSFELSDDSSR